MIRPYTTSPPEELANAITHGLGLLATLLLYPLIARLALLYPDQSMVFGVSAFGFGMLITYLSSTLYHAMTIKKYKDFMQMCDHISIYFLIAGTYTPVILRYVPSTIATPFLIILWSMVLGGSLFKLFFTGRFDWLSTGIYLFMGWMVVFLYKPLSQTMPLEVFWWIFAGGLSYTIGVVFYIWHGLKYHHAIWHIFVLGGTFTQFVAVYISLA